jgi:hypothetical protein
VNCKEIFMMKRLRVFILLILFNAAVTPVLADDVSSVDQMLCAAMEATQCKPDSGCQISSPRTWNIPDFIEIDLIKKQLQTTKASGQNRVTPISTLTRDGETIYIQGSQKGRLFSLVIDGPSGELTAAMASTTAAVSVFAICTPLPESSQE